MQVRRNVALAAFSSMGIGGDAAYLTVVNTISDLKKAILFAGLRHLRYKIVGNGSNCLFADTGFLGLIIVCRVAYCRIWQERVFVGAGYKLPQLVRKTLASGLGGLEFAGGIPATCGGAIYMNCGAYGLQMADVVEKVSFMDPDGQIRLLDKDNLDFAYRSSCFNGMPGAILGAVLALRRDRFAKLHSKEYMQRRLAAQPVKDKSLGSVFRNPEGCSAGALIDSCGLKGRQIGGAAVSAKHANFIVNSGGATAKDVRELINIIKAAVLQKHGLVLQEEIEAFGE